MPSRRANLWVLTCFFNPCGYRRRLANYREFRGRLAAPLITVELSFGGPFELRAEDAEILIQLRGGSLLWQKERLLNIAWAHLPRECRKVAWLDCDVYFESDDWLDAAEALLDKFPIVQPFSRVIDLPRDHFAGAWATSEPASSLLSRIQSSNSVRGDDAPSKPVARSYTGLAWTARREAFEGIGFYDACVLGSGNRAMFCAQTDRCDDAIGYLHMNSAWADHYRCWACRHQERTGGRIAHLDLALFHLWHGDEADRRYAERHQEFAQYEFNPARDIGPDRDGCWVWASEKPRMHDFVRRYFAGRKEDG